MAQRTFGDPPLDVHALGIDVECEVGKAPEPHPGRSGTVACGDPVLGETVADVDAVFARADLRVQPRMYERDVVALAVVVGVRLPVRVDGWVRPWL